MKTACALLAYGLLAIPLSGRAATASVSAEVPGHSDPLPEAPEMRLASSNRVERAPSTRFRLGTRPFSAIAVMTKVGMQGLGIDVATPLATKINVRASISYTNVDPTISYDAVAVEGYIKLRTASVSVDLFPYRGTFHISPGFTVYNDNHALVAIDVPGSQTFTINDTDYTSDPADPIRGNFYFHMGRRMAPSLTVGWGNMLKADQHWSIPVDFGVEYVGAPKFGLYVTGSACDPSEGCFSVVTDHDTQSNLAQEVAIINKDISPLRFYPILSVGLSYRFGRLHDRSNWR
jgi:hypothetical protein